MATQIVLSQAGPLSLREDQIRWLRTIAAYALSLYTVALLAFLIVPFVVGPCVELLPELREPVILIAGCVSVLLVPSQVARKGWRRNS